MKQVIAMAGMELCNNYNKLQHKLHEVSAYCVSDTELSSAHIVSHLTQ